LALKSLLRRGAADCGGTTREVLVSGQRGIGHVANRQPPRLAPRQLDGGAFRRQPLRYRRADHRAKHTALLAREHGFERAALRVICAAVDIHASRAVAGEEVARPPYDQRSPAPAHVDTVDRALADVDHESTRA